MWIKITFDTYKHVYFLNLYEVQGSKSTSKSQPLFLICLNIWTIYINRFSDNDLQITDSIRSSLIQGLSEQI